MKTIFAFALALATAASANAATLIKASRMPGYEINPESRVFTLEDNGRMTLAVHNFGTNKDETIDLGTLSSYAVKKIETEIATLPANARLVDEKEGQPLCADLPSYTTSVVKDGQELEIHRKASCHEWKLDSFDYVGRRLTGLAEGFLD